MSPSGSNDELLATVRAWFAANYPGHACDYLTLHSPTLPVAVSLPVPPAAPPILSAGSSRFIPTPYQRAILEALDGKAMRTDGLAAVVGDRPRLFRAKGGLKELQEQGLVAHHDRLGFFAVASPPPELEEDD